MRREAVIPHQRVVVGSSGIMQKDVKPQGHRSHHMLLHQADAETPVDGILELNDSSKAFSKKQMNTLCKTLKKKVQCIGHVPVQVVRAQDGDLAALLEQLSEVKKLPLKNNLPKVVKYLKKHYTLDDVPDILKQYEDAGVIIPAEAIAAEFRAEGVELAARRGRAGGGQVRAKGKQDKSEQKDNDDQAKILNSDEQDKSEQKEN